MSASAPVSIWKWKEIFVRAASPLRMLTVVLMAATWMQPALAQGNPRSLSRGGYRDGYDEGYHDAFREAYRAGYADGRANRRYDDRYSPPRVVSIDPDGPPPVVVIDRDDPPPVVIIDREDRWRQRYARTYTYNDDSFYQECRESVDPAGVIGGALIGGLLGNAIGRDGGRTGATIAGIVVGGALGTALTRNLECEDRSYAYKTYYDGFNSGRPNSVYQWQNPSNGHYGEFRIADYYDDPDGFRCANFTQQIFIDGRPEAASGRACQQPDGTWAIVS
jgi:surface antigen